MPTIEEVKKTIKDLGEGIPTFLARREIKYLPEILKEEEKILYLTSGFLGKKRWVVVCTDHRIIFLSKGLFWRLGQIETPLEKINAIEQKCGFWFGEIAIRDSSNRIVLTKAKKKTVKPFVAAVNQAIDGIRKKKPSASTADDIASQIERLAALMEKGLLTQEEFQKKKTQLLGL